MRSTDDCCLWRFKRIGVNNNRIYQIKCDLVHGKIEKDNWKCEIHVVLEVGRSNRNGLYWAQAVVDLIHADKKKERIYPISSSFTESVTPSISKLCFRRYSILSSFKLTFCVLLKLQVRTKLEMNVVSFDNIGLRTAQNESMGENEMRMVWPWLHPTCIFGLWTATPHRLHRVVRPMEAKLTTLILLFF